MKLMGLRQYLLLALVVVAVGLGFFYWKTVWQNRDSSIDAGEEFIQNYEEAMTADNYGGKTPEETLNLFIDALKKEDVELASKYFMVDDLGKRDQWVEYLQDVKDQGLMQKMAEDLGEARPDLENIIDENDFKFVIRQEDGLVGADINMEFNKFSGLWKIESL